MTNEIKEILFLLHNDRLTDSGKRKLEDYITNLQEENERLRKDYFTLMQDNAYTLELQQRIDKTIKYLKSISMDKTPDYIPLKDYKEYHILLDILRGDE